MIQFLSFELGGELFAIDIVKIREVLDFTTVTRVPRTPAYMSGVINLRGGVVPVIDMRLKFGMTEMEKTVNTCIVIAEVNVGTESTVLGAMVDSVHEVFDLSSDEIEPAPRIGTRLKVDFLRGMGKKDNELVLILDIDKVFSENEIMEISATGAVGEREIEEVEA